MWTCFDPDIYLNWQSVFCNARCLSRAVRGMSHFLHLVVISQVFIVSCDAGRTFANIQTIAAALSHSHYRYITVLSFLVPICELSDELSDESSAVISGNICSWQHIKMMLWWLHEHCHSWSFIQCSSNTAKTKRRAVCASTGILRLVWILSMFS